MSLEELREIVELSTVKIPRDDHREGHAEDFARWGRRGELAIRNRYGTAWFGLLTRRRWGRVTPERVAETFAVLGDGARGCPDDPSQGNAPVPAR